jgi:hypothetical protein
MMTSLRLDCNPAETLAAFHIFLPEEEVPSAVALPPKEVLQATLERLTFDRELDVEGGEASSFVSPVFLAFFTKQRGYTGPG